jgi:hypothetical protein
MPWIFNIFDKAVQPCIQRRMFPYDLLYLPTYQNIGKWCDCFLEWTMFILMASQTRFSITVRHSSKFKIQVLFSPICDVPLIETVFSRSLDDKPYNERLYDINDRDRLPTSFGHNYQYFQILTSNVQRQNIHIIPCVRHLYSRRLVQNQDRFFTRVLDLPSSTCCHRQKLCPADCCQRKTRYIFVNGIMPALRAAWLLTPSCWGKNYQSWHNHVYNSLALMLATTNYKNHSTVVITTKSKWHQINIGFVPPKAPRPIQVEHEMLETFVEQSTTVLPESYYYDDTSDTNNDFDWYEDFYRARNNTRDWNALSAWRSAISYLQSNPSQSEDSSGKPTNTKGGQNNLLQEPTNSIKFSFTTKALSNPENERLKTRPPTKTLERILQRY